MQYLKQLTTGHIYPYTKILADRVDMVPATTEEAQMFIASQGKVRPQVDVRTFLERTGEIDTPTRKIIEQAKVEFGEEDDESYKELDRPLEEKHWRTLRVLVQREGGVFETKEKAVEFLRGRGYHYVPEEKVPELDAEPESVEVIPEAEEEPVPQPAPPESDGVVTLPTA